jgi:hypothetical protein
MNRIDCSPYRRSAAANSIHRTAPCARQHCRIDADDRLVITDGSRSTTKLRQQFVHLDQKVACNSMHTIRQVGNVRDFSKVQELTDSDP